MKYFLEELQRTKLEINISFHYIKNIKTDFFKKNKSFRDICFIEQILDEATYTSFLERYSLLKKVKFIELAFLKYAKNNDLDDFAEYFGIKRKCKELDDSLRLRIHRKMESK